MGDRIHAVENIAYNRYGLDLSYGWPSLRLVLPEATAGALSTALGQFTVAVLIGSWAIPYLVLGLYWFPALPIAAGCAAVGWARGRVAVTEFSSLAEAALDLHGRALATVQGVAKAGADGPLTVDEGAAITPHRA